MNMEQLYVELHVMPHFYAGRFLMIFYNCVWSSFEIYNYLLSPELEKQESVALSNSLALKDIERPVFF